MAKCPITLEPITKKQGILIKVTHKDNTCVYFLENKEILKTLDKCPLTRFKGVYKYIKLSAMTSKQFNQVIHLEHNHERVAFFTQPTIQHLVHRHFFKPTSATHTPMNIVNHLFSSWAHGLCTGFICAALSKLLIRYCIDLSEESHSIVQGLHHRKEAEIEVCYPLFGLIFSLTPTVFGQTDNPSLKLLTFVMFSLFVILTTYDAISQISVLQNTDLESLLSP